MIRIEYYMAVYTKDGTSVVVHIQPHSDAIQCKISQARASLHSGIRLGSVTALWGQAEVESELPRGFVITLELLEVDNKVVLDGEDRVRGQVWVVSGVDLCCAWLVAFTGDLEEIC